MRTPLPAVDYLLRVYEDKPWFTEHFPPKVHTWDQSIFDDMVDCAGSGHILPLQMLSAHLPNMAQGAKAFYDAVDARKRLTNVTVPLVLCPDDWFPVRGQRGGCRAARAAQRSSCLEAAARLTVAPPCCAAGGPPRVPHDHRGPPALHPQPAWLARGAGWATLP